MKKMMAMAAVTAMVLSLGTAFAGNGDGQAAAGGKTYNGVTRFDLGPKADCDEAPAAGSAAKDKAFSNGVSALELSSSGAKGSCANKAEKEIKAGKGYNGVTAF